MGYKIQVIINSEINKRPVLITQRLQLQRGSRNIHALAVLDHRLVRHHHFQVMLVLFHHDQLHVTIIHQHLISHLYIFGKIRIRHVNQLPVHLQIRLSRQINRFPFIHVNRLVHQHGPHLRSLRIDQNGYIIRNLSNILHYRQRLLHILMSSVQSHDIHTRAIQTFQKFYITSLIRYGSHNLSLLHIINNNNFYLPYKL